MVITLHDGDYGLTWWWLWTLHYILHDGDDVHYITWWWLRTLHDGDYGHYITWWWLWTLHNMMVTTDITLQDGNLKLHYMMVTMDITLHDGDDGHYITRWWWWTWLCMMVTMDIALHDGADGQYITWWRWRTLYGPSADKRNLTTFCNMLSNTHLRSVENHNFLLSFKEGLFMCDT